MTITTLQEAKAFLQQTFDGRDWPKKNWSAYKTFVHCAQTIEYSMTGYPKPKPAFIQNTVGKLVIRKFLKQGHMRHGLTAPVAGAPEIAEAGGSTADGLARLMTAIDTFLAHRGPLQRHLVFGELTHDAYDRYFAMHIVDHLSEFDFARST